jgi:DNA primase
MCYDNTLKATVSVPDFVGRFVPLDRQGRGLCPFHDDQHQSFQVSAEGNFWHCYAGCGGGSIIDFWMKMREKQGQDGSFTETIKELREMLLG